MRSAAADDGGDGEAITGNFVVEEHLRRDLWASAAVEDERDVDSFEVLSPTGRRFSLPHYEHGMAYFNLEGDNEPGIWSYSIVLYPASRESKVHFEVLARPDGLEAKRDSEVGGDDASAVVLESWFEQRKVEGPGGRTEVILYASLERRGSSSASLPVLGASVVASVSRPGRPADEVPVEVVLRDAGTGYPDVTSGDGVYSAYFSAFSAESGLYSVSVRASSNDGGASTPKVGVDGSGGGDGDGGGGGGDGNSACCGSVLPFSYTVPTGPFLRFVEAPSFYVEQPVDSFYVRQQQERREEEEEEEEGGGRLRPPLGLVNDVFPPSRVTDFR